MHFRNLSHRGRPRHNWDEMAAISSIDFDEDVKPDRPAQGAASSRGPQPAGAQPGCARGPARGGSTGALPHATPTPGAALPF